MIKLRPAPPRVRFALLFAGLALCYSLWLIACWPGILGQDSLAIMLEVETQRDFQAGKPAFWYLYVLALYGPWRLVEIPITLQLLICALVCARILSWMWEHGMRKSFLYSLLFVALAPSVMYYTSSLYSDGIYSIAVAGMLFEVWRSYRTQHVDRSSCWMFLLTIPFALFSRPNGVINGVALVALFLILPKSSRWKIVAVALPWLIFALFAHSHYKYRSPIGSVFPLALYETVGFLEDRPMNLWERNEPRVTDKTVEALTSTHKSLEHIRSFYDHYYWDPLIFFPQGPSLLDLSKDAKKTIVREFFTYNLWHNFPAFAASRVNIFLYSAFADGDFPGLTNAENILPQTRSESEIRFRHGALHRWVAQWIDFSLKYRVIFWTPWFGLFLIILACVRSYQRKDRAALVISAVFILQLGAVAVFSIAGEYRYLLAFFTSPLALLPIIYSDAKPAHA